MSVLFDECLAALGARAVLCSESDIADFKKNVLDGIPFLSWGRVDWSKACVDFVGRADDVKDYLISSFCSLDSECSIFWSDAGHGMVRCDLESFFCALDDVLAVDFDSYIFLPGNMLIEFWHDGVVTCGRFRTIGDRPRLS